MNNRTLFYKLSLLFMCLVLIVVGMNINIPKLEAAGINDPDIAGLKRTATYIDSTPKTETSQLLDLSGYISGFNYAMIIGDVKISGERSFSGQAPIFINRDAKQNNGYPYVRFDGTQNSDAYEWARQLGGNVAWIFNGTNAYTISTNPGNFTGVSLAKIVELSGGYGAHNGILKPAPGYNNKDYGAYKPEIEFVTTKRPEGGVRVAQPTYKQGETVKIMYSGTDYSGFDKGIEVVNLAVEAPNGNRSPVKSGEIIKLSAATDQPASFKDREASFSLPANAQLGTYTVYYIIRDLHYRSRQGSPSISESTPYTATFTVIAGDNPGTCSKVDATLKISGQTDRTLSSGGSYKMPQGKNTISSLVFPVAGTLKVGSTTVGSGSSFSNILIDTDRTLVFTPTDPKNCEWSVTIQAADPVEADCASCKGVLRIKTYTASGKGELDGQFDSGGSKSVSKDTDYLQITAPVQGKWYDANGNQIPTSTYVTGTTYTVPNFTQDSLTIKFVSNDGSYCWCKTLYRGEDETENSCPVVYRGGSSVPSGTTLTNFTTGQSLTLKATYKNEYGNTQPAGLYWRITRPDGSVYLYQWLSSEDAGGREHIMQQTASEMIIPNPRESPDFPADKKFSFDKKGRYKIEYYYDPSTTYQPNKDWTAKNCQWSIYVEVTELLDPKNIDCPKISVDVTLDGYKPTMTGSGTASEPYVLRIPQGEPNDATFTLLYGGNPGLIKGWFYIEYKKVGGGGGGSGMMDMSYRYTFGDYKPNEVTQFDMRINVNKSGDYLAEPDPAKDCIIYVKIIWGDPIEFDCSKVFHTAVVDGVRQTLTGNGTSSSPYKLSLKTDKTYSVDIGSYLETPTGGSAKQIEAVNYELKKEGGTTTYTGSGNPFTRSFSESSPTTYNLKIKVKGKGESVPCETFMVIEFKPVSCEDLFIQEQYSDGSSWVPGKGDGYLESPGSKRYKNPQGPLGVKFAVTTDSHQPSAGNTLKVTWTVTNTDNGRVLANQSAEPSIYFEHTISEKGHFQVKAKVTDTSKPGFVNCEFFFVIVISDPDMSCDNFYLHVSTPNQLHYNANGKTITFPSSPQSFAFLVADRPDDISSDYSGLLVTDWQAPTPFKNSMDEQIPGWSKYIFYQNGPVPDGTYKIVGTMNDPKYTSKCRFEVTIVIGEGTTPEPCTTCNPGGEIEGGKLNIRIFDSSNRLLTEPSDGVWEREPARVEVSLNQTDLDNAFGKIDQAIQSALEAKKAELLSRYSAAEFENVVVTANPQSWSSKTSPNTTWPATFKVSVTGPGINQDFQMNPRLTVQSGIYTGATVPTLTTWNMELNKNDYTARTDGFSIDAPYRVDFAVSYDRCEQIPDPDWVPDPDDPEGTAPLIKKCTPGNDQDRISNSFTILVAGDEAAFEAYEPNATGKLAHTAEWAEYHARDRYRDSQPLDFYAGERILARVHLEPRHMHPFSRKYPQIASAKAWISEVGKNSTLLQSTLSLQASSAVLWKGGDQVVPKLGPRETGVDTPLMGDKQKGFAKGQSYSVFFEVQFAHQVKKGFTPFNKSSLLGNHAGDYRSIIRIIANSWERQGIRNHTSQ